MSAAVYLSVLRCEFGMTDVCIVVDENVSLLFVAGNIAISSS